MKKSILAIAAVMVLAWSIPAFAVSLDINLGGKPQRPVVVAPAPVVVAPAAPVVAPGPMVQYQYYPAHNIYFDPSHNQYWSQQGGRWTAGPLPRHIHPNRLGAPQVVSAPNNPWEHRGDHRGPMHRDDHRGPDHRNW